MSAELTRLILERKSNDIFIICYWAAQMATVSRFFYLLINHFAGIL